MKKKRNLIKYQKQNYFQRRTICIMSHKNICKYPSSYERGNPIQKKIGIVLSKMKIYWKKNEKKNWEQKQTYAFSEPRNILHRVLNPHKWSLAKEINLKHWNVMPISSELSWSQRNGVTKPNKLRNISVWQYLLIKNMKCFKNIHIVENSDYENHEYIF